MGQLIIEIKSVNGNDNLAAMLEYNVKFDKTINAEFLEKVIDIKAVAEHWTGVSLVKEYVADYVDITQKMQSMDLKPRQKAITTDMQNLVDSIKKLIKDTETQI